MEEITLNVNWLAVIVGFVVAFLVGWVWYLPSLPIGKRWIEGVGMDPASPPKPSVTPMVWQLIGTFLLAWLVGVTAANNALLTIILAAFAVAALTIATGQFSRKSSFASFAEGGYVIIMFVIMIIFQGIF